MSAPGMCSTSFSMYCSTQGTYRNGTSLYICMCGVMEYCATGNATPVCNCVRGTLISLSLGLNCVLN